MKNIVEFEKGFQEALKNVLAITDKKESVREYTNLILFDFKDGFCKIVWTNGDILFVSKNFETSYKYTEKKLIEIKDFLSLLEGYIGLKDSKNEHIFDYLIGKTEVLNLK